MNSSTLTRVVLAASQLTGLDPECITSPYRRLDLVRARCACYLVLQSIGWPNTRTAAYFQGMDGGRIAVSTVCHAINRSKKRSATDPDFASFVEQIKTLSTPATTPNIGLRYARREKPLAPPYDQD